MKKIIFVFSFVVSFYCCSGQQPDTIDLSRPIDFSALLKKHRRIPDNSIYLELAGHMNVVSVNYERVFFHAHDFYITGRIGLGYTPPVINTLSLPILTNGFYQVSNVFLIELGFGVNFTWTFWNGYNSDDGQVSGSTWHESGSFIDLLLTGYAGIRLQKKKGFLFRFGFTPVYEITEFPENRTSYMQLGTKDAFVPWVGMSFGYSF